MSRGGMRVGRMRIGLAVSQDFVRAVALKRDRVLWATAAQRDGEALQATIERVLAGSPMPRWPRAIVIAAVGPSAAQTKRLAGLPALRAGREMDALVQESAARLFLRNGTPVVTAVSMSTRTAAWGAAFDRDTIDAIVRACRARRAYLDAVVPSVAVLGLAVEGEHLLWRDGETIAEIETHRGELRGSRRFTSATSGVTDTGSLVPTPLLAPLGEDACHFADALGAAVAPKDVLAWHPNVRDAHAVPRGRLAIASIVTVIVATGWLAAPGIAASFAQRKAERRLTATTEVRRSVVLAERELARVTSALAEVAAFDSGAVPATMLLADLTRALPEGAAVVALRLTSGTSSIVSLAPRAAAVLAALERVPGVEAGEIVGPVTREVVGTQTVERVTVRFRFSVASRRGREARR